MRIGGMSASTHAAGMSALWHDADYVPEQRFETPRRTAVQITARRSA